PEPSQQRQHVPRPKLLEHPKSGVGATDDLQLAPPANAAAVRHQRSVTSCTILPRNVEFIVVPEQFASESLKLGNRQHHDDVRARIGEPQSKPAQWLKGET